MQLRVLGFGLLQDWDIGIDVFPEGEEVLIRGAARNPMAVVPRYLVREDDFQGVGFDEREAARGCEPWNKQPIMISKDAAPIISFPMKNPTIGTVNAA